MPYIDIPPNLTVNEEFRVTLVHDSDGRVVFPSTLPPIQPSAPPYIWSRTLSNDRRRLAECHECGTRVEAETRATFVYRQPVNGNREFIICARCASPGDCAQCHEPMFAESNVTVFRGRRICTHHIRLCEGCGQPFLREMLRAVVFSSDDGLMVCTDCAATYTICLAGHAYKGTRCGACDEMRVNSHDYRVFKPPLLATTPDEKLFLGVELEVEYTHANNREVRRAMSNLDLFKYAYLKHDGSLADGVEIVSFPATLAYHKEVLPWTPLCALLTRHYMVSDSADTTGLHVHLSRNALPSHAWQRFAFLVNNLRPLMEKVARRGESARYAAYKKKLTITGAANSRDRYEATNFTNTHTVELRIFKGTLNPSYLYATLEFCVALATFCRTTPARQLHDLDKAQVALLKHCRNGQYAYLPRYLTEVCHV